MIASRSTVQQHIPGDIKAQSRWAHNNVVSSKFYFMRVRLLNIAAPAQLDNIMANATERFCPLIVDTNKHGYGVGGYVPKCVVIAGAAQRRRALDRGALFAMAWVGEKALQAAGASSLDGISMDELNQKVSASLTAKYMPSSNSSGAYPGDCCVNGSVWVRQLYPFDNYCIFEMRGKSYKQSYTIDTSTREVKLSGSPSEVEQEFVEIDGCDGIQAFSSSPLPYVPLGMKVSPDFILPSLFTVSFGAGNSELRNPSYGEAFLNVDDVVTRYLANVRNGYHSPVLPPSAPIANVQQQIFANEVRARGVQSPADFLLWAAKNKKAVQVGAPVDKGDFAYIGDPKKKSTWKLPIHNADHVRNAMARFGQTEGIPESEKPKVVHKIVNKAKTLGIDTTDFETEHNVKACDDDEEMTADTKVKNKIKANSLVRRLLGK